MFFHLALQLSVGEERHLKRRQERENKCRSASQKEGKEADMVKSWINVEKRVPLLGCMPNASISVFLSCLYVSKS